VIIIRLQFYSDELASRIKHLPEALIIFTRIRFSHFVPMKPTQITHNSESR